MMNVTLPVKGMSCQHCVNSIDKALQQVGVTGKVDLKNNTVNVSFEENQITIEGIKAAIEAQGYDVLH